MTEPTRIQRRRTRGWRMPENAVYVGRPSKWGNTFVIGRDGDAAECVRLYRARVNSWTANIDEIQSELRGRSLACWCPLDRPCHADVLLEIANS